LRRGPATIEALIRRFGWRSAAEATPGQLCAWLAEQGGSGHTQNNRVAMIRAFFHHCHKTLRSVTVNPAADLERASSARGDGVREFTAGEMARLFQTARGHWKVAVGLMATTALRRGAVFRGVRVGWFDAPNRQLRIPAGVLKNRKAQAIPLNEDAMQILEVAVSGREPQDFVVPIKPDHRAWSRLLRDAKVRFRDDRGRPCGMHSFRKGVLTSLADLGVHPKVAQELAGHSDIRLTIGVYTRFNAGAQADAVKKLPRLSAHGIGGLRDSTEKRAVGVVDNEGGKSDTDHADLERTDVVASQTQPGKNARPCDDPPFHGQQSSVSATTCGRAFQPGPNENPERHAETTQNQWAGGDSNPGRHHPTQFGRAGTQHTGTRARLIAAAADLAAALRRLTEGKP